jgi:arginine-tRNA-protein transferase
MNDVQQTSHWPTWPLPIAGVLTEETPGHPCSYLPQREARFRAFAAEHIAPQDYHALMDAGFRRSGRLVYQPMCNCCRACVPLRVDVQTVEITKSLRRLLRKNADLAVRVGEPQPSAEKWRLYERYQANWHAKPASEGRESVLDFIRFLYDSPVETAEFEYRDPAGELLGVGICDVSPRSISSVYFYFDPAHAARSLGTFSALYEMLWAREMKIPYWYAGYCIAGCDAMAYKNRFHPHELLGTDGVWRTVNPSG